jgi:Cu+-exporting ATPase
VEWTAATITVAIILTLTLGRTVMDRQWPKAIGILLLVGLIAVPMMISRRTAQSDLKQWDAVEPAIQTAAIIVDTAFVPDRIQFAAGVPAKLIFLRNTGGECNEAIVFPALNKRVELPIGQRVEVEFSGGEVRRLDFTCLKRKMRGFVEFST